MKLDVSRRVGNFDQVLTFLGIPFNGRMKSKCPRNQAVKIILILKIVGDLIWRLFVVLYRPYYLFLGFWLRQSKRNDSVANIY